MKPALVVLLLVLAACSAHPVSHACSVPNDGPCDPWAVR